MKKQIRIAGGQGFWGDLPDAPINQVEGGPIDYLMLDYLAEVTMSIMQKQKARDPAAGYAKDFIPLMQKILPACLARNIRVTANAGGVNVEGCATQVREVARKLGMSGKIRIGIVTGDDLMSRLDELLGRGIELRNMDTNVPLTTIRDRIQSANAYLGAAPIVEALDRAAHVVITGRATDTGLSLAPMIHEFGWARDDWNKLAAGTIAGHIIECGAQASGGNCQYEWRNIPDLANVGFPIAEARLDGTFVITKHEGTGGLVNIPAVKEQLVYEMGDPREYITPDCVADFTTIQLENSGPNRVRVFGIEGRPATEFLKVSISYAAGFKAVGTLVYAWPRTKREPSIGREIYEGDCPSDSYRATCCYRFRWRQTKSGGDCCLLACLNSQTRDHCKGRRYSGVESAHSTDKTCSCTFRRQGRYRECWFNSVA